MTSPIFVTDSLTRVFGKPPHQIAALNNVNLTVNSGDRLGVVGGSGSGKSTLVRLLAALDRPTSGSIAFDGRDITSKAEHDLGELRARVQLVFQDPRSSLNPRMKISEIVAEPLRSKVIRRYLGEIAVGGRVLEVLQAVGLDADALARYPHEFSGGQRQRIAIARALAPHPQVLIADEPVSALDVLVRDQIIELLDGLVVSQSLTLIMVSHDLSIVRRLCDSVVVMNEGEIIERGTVSQVLNHPKTSYTQALLEAVPSIRLGQ